MFGHLKPAEFMNIIEGSPVHAKRQGHLDGCERCRMTLAEMQSAYRSVSDPDEDFPKVDWEQFRSRVRDGLLVRAVQRESREARWLLWPSRPALSWSLSLLLSIGLTSSLLVWYYAPRQEGGVAAGPPAVAVSSDTPVLEPEMMVWSARGVFEELGALDDREIDKLRQLLAEAQEKR